MLVCAITLPITDAGAQEQAHEPKILSKSDCESLNRRAKEWFEAWMRYEVEAESDRDRGRAGRALDKAKEAFMKDWESKSRKGDPLASVADLKAIFHSAFPYPRQQSSGILKQFKAEGRGAPYWLLVPRRYDQDTPYRTLLVVPGYDEQKGAWGDPQDYHEATWQPSSLAEDTLVMVPELDPSLDLDVVPDFTKPGQSEQEVARLAAILGAAGQMQREFNVDRERLFLDSGQGASGFALRMASYFPHRFAGLILRWPVDVTKDLRLGTVTGLPVLLISSEQTKAACDALAKALNEQQADSCTVIEGKGAYPFTESQAEIDAWVKDLRRDLTPNKVVVEPNHDSFNEAYWVRLGRTEPLEGLADDKKPRFVATVDKEANRITIESRGVEDFLLLLNDDLLDLDKEFTVDVNGELFKEKRERSLRFVTDQMLDLFDPTWVFVSEFATAIGK